MLNKLEEFKERFRSYPNIEIEEATHMPLYELLNKSHFVMSLWSTVLFEGLQFGCRGICIDEYGYSLLKEDIDQGVINYVSSVNELELLVLKRNSFDLKNSLEDDMEKIRANIQNFMNP
jgi:hypothetical protein